MAEYAEPKQFIILFSQLQEKRFHTRSTMQLSLTDRCFPAPGLNGLNGSCSSRQLTHLSLLSDLQIQLGWAQCH